MRSSSNTVTTVISKLRRMCEKPRCECLELFLLWNAVERQRLCGCSQQPALSVCFSHPSILSVLLPHAWDMKDLFGFAPAPTILKRLHVRVLTSSLLLKSFMLQPLSSTKLSQRRKHFPNETSSRPFPLHITLSAFVSVAQPMNASHCLSPHSSVFSRQGLFWPNERSMPMWLSSPQGTVQVSRLAWRIQAQNVTNAFGEALVPKAHCSTPVLEHGNHHHRNSSREGSCISHSRCFFMPIPAHSITDSKPDGALSLPLSLLFSGDKNDNNKPHWSLQCAS